MILNRISGEVPVLEILEMWSTATLALICFKINRTVKKKKIPRKQLHKRNIVPFKTLSVSLQSCQQGLEYAVSQPKYKTPILHSKKKKKEKKSTNIQTKIKGVSR